MTSETAIISTSNPVNPDLIKKYDVACPRYTSYPTAQQFHSGFGAEDYRQQIGQEVSRSIAPLSLYVHIPFCRNICYYCACNKIVTSDNQKARVYLDYLNKEIQMQGRFIGKRRKVMQLHLGGGTPTFLDGAELTELMHSLAMSFSLTDSDQREYSIELDPRTVTDDSLALLKGLGFNRLSLGVQDFDSRVQVAINRRQSFDLIRQLTETARLYQFKSISFDLIYGLPFQSPESLSRTLQQVLTLSPDRIAFYNYAHLPERFKSQRAIDRQELPSAEQKLAMLSLISETLQQGGYRHIGMDHFVKPEDDLAKAQVAGTLQRNFQGYSTCKANDLLGLGVSAISSMQNFYSQNTYDLEDYYAHLDRLELPVIKGLHLNEDDQLRRHVIAQISCQLRLNTREIEDQFDICFSEYFARELQALRPLEKDGLIEWRNATLFVTEQGRAMLRNICVCFDKYLQQTHLGSGTAVNFSKAL